jgi:hypothetical protein
MIERKVSILTIVALVLMLAVIPAYAAEPAEPKNANAMWIEPAISTPGAFYVNLAGYAIGTRFNVTVWANCSAFCGGWQFWLVYENATITATKANYTLPDASKSEFFQNVSTIPVTASFKEHNATFRRAEFGESWAGTGSKRDPGYGTLANVEFEVIADSPSAMLGFYGYTGTVRRTYLINGTDSTKVDLNVYGASVVPEFNPTIVLTILATITIPTAIVIRRKKF